MALRIHAANRPKLDHEGYVHAVLKSITVEPSNDKRDWEQLKWEFVAEATIRPITQYVRTGFSFANPDEGEKMNRLTVLCLGLQLFTREELETAAEEIDVDLENLGGMLVRYKIVKKNNFYEIDLDTLTLDK